MATRLIFAFCFLNISAANVFADQCMYVASLEQAMQAWTYLKYNEKIYEYCAPCGDAAASPIAVKLPTVARGLFINEPTKGKFPNIPKSTVVKLPGGGEFQVYESGYMVMVNGKAIDLAYTYVPLKGQYKNLAKLAGCPSDDVPLILPKEKMPR